MKKEEVRSGDWQRPALSCCRNETSLLQIFFIENFVMVKNRFIISSPCHNLKDRCQYFLPGKAISRFSIRFFHIRIAAVPELRL